MNYETWKGNCGNLLDNRQSLWKVRDNIKCNNLIICRNFETHKIVKCFDVRSFSTTLLMLVENNRGTIGIGDFTRLIYRS